MLEVKNLKKIYKTKNDVVTDALDGVSIQFPEKGLVFLLGKSGSGKSTLLNVCGGLDACEFISLHDRGECTPVRLCKHQSSISCRGSRRYGCDQHSAYAGNSRP